MESSLFSGKSAWFSSSVDRSISYLWEIHGGTCSERNNANFLFSEDVDEEDTKSLYNSEAYLREHLAVFHAQYITDTVGAADPSSVVLGDYYLPPPEVIKELRENHKPKVIQIKGYSSLLKASKETIVRKRKCSGDIVSPPNAKENVPGCNDQRSSKQSDAGEEKHQRQAKRPFNAALVSTEISRTPHTKQHGEEKRDSKSARKQKSADTAGQTPRKGSRSKADYQQPLMDTDYCMHNIEKRTTKGKTLTRCSSLDYQPAPTPTRSQGIQTVEDPHTMETQDSLIVERVENLHTQGEVYERTMMEYSHSCPWPQSSELQHDASSSHHWEGISHQSPRMYRTDSDHGISGAPIANPRENFSRAPRHEAVFTQGKEPAVYIDSLHCTDAGKEKTPKKSFSCVML